jgi:hypothetical protein
VTLILTIFTLIKTIDIIIIYIFIYSPKGDKSYYIQIYTKELELIKRVTKIQIEKSAFIINIMLKVSVSDSHKSYLTVHF